MEAYRIDQELRDLSFPVSYDAKKMELQFKIEQVYL